jgi:hypothetical protein
MMLQDRGFTNEMARPYIIGIECQMMHPSFLDSRVVNDGDGFGFLRGKHRNCRLG